MNNCKMAAEELGVLDHVFFLGTKTNPYAYMRDCDVYVQPSRHEGFCITLAEALCFDNPIVSTDFTGAKEQLVNRKNSIVVGMEPENIAYGIEKMLIEQ
jgi:glycosyltransferase involved in cell wall biosynthesis